MHDICIYSLVWIGCFWESRIVTLLVTKKEKEKKSKFKRIVLLFCWGFLGERVPKAITSCVC
jgi:hypothetical protein